MFARAAQGARRSVILRRTILLGGPPAIVCFYSATPIYNDGPRRETQLKGQSGSGGSPNDSTGVLQNIRQKFTSAGDEAGDGSNTWAAFSQKFYDAGNSVASFDWSSYKDKVQGTLIPSWASSIPSYIRKLQAELEWKPGSLADEILNESADPEANPEIVRTARVRHGQKLCSEEIAFQGRRKKHTVKALARYLDIPEHEIHPEDVPVIAMCGSGGGLRALVAGANSYRCVQEAGLWDCVTYTSGVSGSCWMQTLYNSSLSHQDFGALINHLKKRIGVHIAFPPPALNLLATAPTNKFLLAGLLEKNQADPEADFGLVDIYGLLLATRLMVPRGELEIDPNDLKISHQSKHIKDGSHPLPIYTAVRHEIGQAEDKREQKRLPLHPSEAQKQAAQEETWFQWFEWTPYEFWCEEIEAGIPTWSLGRLFKDGVSVPRESGYELPEMRIPQLLGIWGSAFCATLSHYYAEIRPLVKGLKGFGGIDDLIEDRDSDLVRVHPIDPASIPNFVRGLDDKLPSSTPPSILSDTHLQLMDAGMSNNLPIYPLLRPGRDVDILIAFDASADPKNDNWLAHVDGYARQRGIAGWPMGAGWPSEVEKPEDAAHDLDEKRESAGGDKDSVTQLDASSTAHGATGRDKYQEKEGSEDQGKLSHCTIWIGSTQERVAPDFIKAASSKAEHESTPSSNDTTTHADTSSSSSPSSSTSSSPSTSRVSSSSSSNTTRLSSNSSDWSPLPPSSGLAVIYFPLTVNPTGAPGVDPQQDPAMSTWNFIYTPQDIDRVGDLARANWNEGAEQTRRCVRAVYERKKGKRLQAEKDKRWSWLR